MLHASGAVGPSGRAHVFVGENGHGQEHPCDGDGDAAGLVPARRRRRACDHRRSGPVPRRPWLRGCAPAAGLGERCPPRGDRRPTDGYVATTSDASAQSGDAAIPLARAAVPIAALYDVVRSPDSTLDDAPLGFQAALIEINRHVHHGPLVTREQIATDFERVSALVAAVDVRRLSMPDGLKHLGDTADLLRAREGQNDVRCRLAHAQPTNGGVTVS